MKGALIYRVRERGRERERKRDNIINVLSLWRMLYLVIIFPVVECTLVSEYFVR